MRALQFEYGRRSRQPAEATKAAQRGAKAGDCLEARGTLTASPQFRGGEFWLGRRGEVACPPRRDPGKGRMVAMGKPRVVAWFVDAPIADDDPLRVVKLRARQLCDPHYQAGQSAQPLQDAAACFADPCLDPESVWDAGLASGLTDANLDSAAYVAVTLAEVERYYRP